MAKKARTGVARTKTKPDAGPTSVDEVLGALESVVKELEGGDLPLEQALERFESGVKLARQGGNMLDAVEQRVEMLIAESGETEHFSTDDDDGDAGGDHEEGDHDRL